MAQTLNTVIYVYEQISSLGTIPTFFGNITVDLPDIAAVVNPFKSVKGVLTANDASTIATNNTNRSFEIGFNGGARTVYSNINTMTNSAESITLRFEADLTSQFNAGFPGTSATVDAAGTFNPTYRNANLYLEITYVKDTTAATHVKTVYLPLDTKRTTLPSSKSTVFCTIPALDTELPEASKSYVNRAVWLWGTTNLNAVTTDLTLSTQIDTGTIATAFFEGALSTSVFFDFKSVAAISGMTTNAPHSFYVWANAINYFPNVCGMITVTYTYDAATTTSLFISQTIPWGIKSSWMGLNTEYQHAVTTAVIPESNITRKNIAFYLFGGYAVAPGTITLKFTTTGALTYGIYSAVVSSGGYAIMYRNDAAYTLARGNNTLEAQISSNSSPRGGGISGFWILNYTCDVPSTGIGTESKSIRYLGASVFTGTATSTFSGTTAPVIPDTNWFLSNIGIHANIQTNTTSTPAFLGLELERNQGTSTVKYEPLLHNAPESDSEVGPLSMWETVNGIFGRWENATIIADNPWLNLQTSRSWRFNVMLNNGTTNAVWMGWDYWWIQHSITHTISGTISGSTGGAVNIRLVSVATGETFRQTSVAGDSAFSLTWYDDVTPTYLLVRDLTDLTRTAIVETLTFASGTPNDNINVGTVSLAPGVDYRIVNPDTRMIRF